MKFFETMERKKQALDRMLAAMEESGSVSLSGRHAAIGDNEAAWELGAFDGADKDPPFDDQRRDGFIIRARRDALVAKMNSGAAVDAIERIEAKLQRIELLAGLAAAFAFGVLIKLSL